MYRPTRYNSILCLRHTSAAVRSYNFRLRAATRAQVSGERICGYKNKRFLLLIFPTRVVIIVFMCVCVDDRCRTVAQIYGTAKYKLTFQSCLFFMAPEYRPSRGGKVNEYDGFFIIIIVIYYAGEMRKTTILFYFS